MTDYYKWPCILLTGGGDGALDAIDGSLLVDGHSAYVDLAATQEHLVYELDADSGATENSPYVISPDSNAGTKRWVLMNRSAEYSNFLQSGTGAATRTAQDKMRDFVTPQDFGAVGDGTTDDTDAINAALATAAPAVAYPGTGNAGRREVYFPDGVYKTTSCIYVPRESHIHFAGNAVIHGVHTGPAVLSLKGSSRSILYSPNVLGTSPTYPKTGISLGRSNATPPAGNCGENILFRPYVDGYFSEAGIYSIAAEIISYYSPRVMLTGGGAKYCYYTSDEDDLSIDSFVTGSNTVVSVYDSNFVNEQTGLSEPSNIYIGINDDRVFSHFYSAGWMGAADTVGGYIRIHSEYHGTASGPIIFLAPHGEGTITLARGIYFTTTSVADDIVLNGIEVIQGYFNCAGYGTGTYGHFAYGNDNIKLLNCKLESQNAIHTSVYKSDRVDFGQHGTGLYTVRSTYLPRTFDGQVVFRYGASTPVGAVTPLYTGEEYLHTTGNHWFKAYGPTSSDWSALS